MSIVLNSVWLIDDDSDEHFLLKRAFSRSGICPDARSFVQPQEAVDAFAQLCAGEGAQPWPDLLVVDMNMPRLDGFDCITLFESAAAAVGRVAPRSILLSSALPPGAEKSAERLASLLCMLEKPLTANLLTKILPLHFPS